MAADKFAQEEVTGADKVEEGVAAAAVAVGEEEEAPAAAAAAVAEHVDEAVSIDEIDESEKLLASLMAHIGETKKMKQKKVLAAAEAWMTAELAIVREAKKSSLFTMLEHLPENVMKHSSVVLKVMYDHDAVTEEDISAWHGAADAENEAVINAQDFIDFLKQ